MRLYMDQATRYTITKAIDQYIGKFMSNDFMLEQLTGLKTQFTRRIGDTSQVDLTAIHLGIVCDILPKASFLSPEDKHTLKCVSLLIQSYIHHTQDYLEHLDTIGDHNYQNARDLGDREAIEIFIEDGEYVKSI